MQQRIHSADIWQERGAFYGKKGVGALNEKKHLAQEEGALRLSSAQLLGLARTHALESRAERLAEELACRLRLAGDAEQLGLSAQIVGTESADTHVCA